MARKHDIPTTISGCRLSQHFWNPTIRWCIIIFPTNKKQNMFPSVRKHQQLSIYMYILCIYVVLIIIYIYYKSYFGFHHVDAKHGRSSIWGPLPLGSRQSTAVMVFGPSESKDSKAEVKDLPGHRKSRASTWFDHQIMAVLSSTPWDKTGVTVSDLWGLNWFNHQKQCSFWSHPWVWLKPEHVLQCLLQFGKSF